MFGVSASVNLPLHNKVQKFSSGTSSPRVVPEKGHKTVVVCGGGNVLNDHIYLIIICLFIIVTVMLMFRSDMWTAVNRFSRRVASFDKTMFLTRDVINVVTRHFRDIRYADRRYEHPETL